MPLIELSPEEEKLLVLGSRIYKGMGQRGELEGLEGKTLAIEVNSGDYFVGKDTLDAYSKAAAKYPGTRFYFMNVRGEQKLQ